MTTPRPERLGRYPVRGVLGAGAMGVVYLGHDPQIQRPVAIKTIHRHLLDRSDDDDPLDASGRFRIEAQAAGRLNHPGIVTIYDIGEDAAADCAYFAMEYVRGHSLRDYLVRGWRFTPGEVVSLVSQLLDALAEAHGKGVLHRDIKPANLLIADTGRLKVTDFGIARLETTQFTRTRTRAESVLGSPGYMAPEQYVGGDIDSRVDLFATGVLLYRLLCGRMPYAGTDQAMMYQVVYGEPDALCATPDDAALAPFEPVVRRALARQPEQRFASATEFRQHLLAIAPAGWQPEPLRRERLIAPDEVTRLPPPPADTRGTPAPPVTAPPVPTGWNEATLTGLERELARLVGPIARLLVRRTAAQTRTLDTLRQQVAVHIADPQQRERFLSGTGTGAGTGSGMTTATRTPTRLTATSSAPSTTPPVAQPVAGTPLTPADVDAAASVMATQLGPIAKVLARRCAAASTTREQFVDALLQQIGSGPDASTLKTRLWTTWR